MQKILVVSCLAVWMALSPASFSRATDERSFTMTFNPPEMTYDLIVKSTKVRDMGDYGMQTDKGSSQSRITVDKTPEGFTVTSKPTAMALSRNGETIEDPSQQIILDSQIVYKLGPDGHLLTIEGYGDVVERLQSSLPVEVRAAAAQLFNESALVERDTAEWHGRIGDFIGKTLKAGEAWAGEYEFPLPTGGMVHYYSVGRVKEVVPCGSARKECLKIEFKYNSDAKAVGEMMGTVLRTASGEAPLDVDTSVTQPQIDGEGTRLIDPSTMLIYEETVVRTITMNMTLPNGSVLPTKMTETKEYTYQYPGQ